MPVKVCALGDVGLKESSKGGLVELACLSDYADAITKVVSGDEHCVALLRTGQLIVWGKSSHGRLGAEGSLPDVVDRPMLLDLDDVVDVACGSMHSVAVTADGTAYAWGRNDEGQLGIGNLNHQPTPHVVPKSSPWPFVAAAAGRAHSVFLSSRGHVYVTGRGVEGQLGSSGVKYYSSPHIVKALSEYEVSFIIGGGNMTMFITADGSAWTCGENCTGVLALGDSKQRRVPTKVHAETQDIEVEEVIKANTPARYGTAESYMYSRLRKPLDPIDPEGRFTKIAVGWGHALFLDASGRVHASGSNVKGELGIGVSKKNGQNTLQSVPIQQPINERTRVRRRFKIGGKVQFLDGREGVVTGHARGRVGVKLNDSGAVCGAHPCDLHIIRDAGSKSPRAASPRGASPRRRASMLFQDADWDSDEEEHVFVDDIACGSTYSAAVSGGMLFVWGHFHPDLENPPDPPRLSNGKIVPLYNPPPFGGPNPTFVPPSLLQLGAGAEEMPVEVVAMYTAGQGIFLLLDTEAGTPQTTAAASPAAAPADEASSAD
eukprot:TRINITY_DN1916_c1_g1_i1.p1 TRINITY_DN1916_c1_g1~~TRINITY_DN1916_c1_g1_i1.p1  ORF type:complete len:571 (+),score=206.10 TRINITY_DN1916_c1_g1_i1:81-1715(+)